MEERGGRTVGMKPAQYAVAWQVNEHGRMGNSVGSTLAAARRTAEAHNGDIWELVNLRQEGVNDDGLPVWVWDDERVLG